MAGIYNASASANTIKPGKINNSGFYDISRLIQAGINPKNGLPIKMDGSQCGEYKDNVKLSLRVLDEQNAVNRYRWYNLPCSISSQELERLIYYKGQLAFFYLESSNEFYFMPYALDGGIDFYGRYKTIHPIPFAEGTTDEDKKRLAEQRNFLSTLKLKCVYDVNTEELIGEELTNKCVLIHDYTKQMSQTIIPRQQIQDGILDIMSDCIPFMRTALLNSTGIQGMRVQTQDEYSNVEAASQSVNIAALKGKKYIPVVGSIDFQELTGGDVAKSEEFLLAMQSLDNYRLSLYGLDNGGIFQKKAQVLQAEQTMNSTNASIILQDGLSIRQHFCDIVNSIWPLGIWCEISETAAGYDINGDYIPYDEEDQTGSYIGEQPQIQAEEVENV